jgi:hypothetical protein
VSSLVFHTFFGHDSRVKHYSIYEVGFLPFCFPMYTIDSEVYFRLRNSHFINNLKQCSLQRGPFYQTLQSTNVCICDRVNYTNYLQHTERYPICADDLLGVITLHVGLHLCGAGILAKHGLVQQRKIMVN